MGAVDRYVFRQAAISFAGGLFLLTIVVWVTQVLRQVDLVTNNGQTLMVFFSVASLVIPMLLSLLAPIALFVAVVQTLNKLSGDSELIVMSAAGMSPQRLMRPYLMLTAIVALLVSILALQIAPASGRALREMFGKISANVLTVIVQPGQFSTVEKGLTFHIRDRTAGGVLRGILVFDNRNSKIHTTYVAQRGIIAELPQGNFLVLEDGNMQRKQTESDETTIVTFDRYALDLSDMTKQGETHYRPQERTIAELLQPQSKTDIWTVHSPGAYRQELFDRIAAPLYPLAMMLIAFALLGRARTTRQGRAWSILGAIFAMALIRGLGFAVSGLAAGNPLFAPLIFAVPLMAIAIYGAAALGFYDIAPEGLIEKLSTYSDRMLNAINSRLKIGATS